MTDSVHPDRPSDSVVSAAQRLRAWFRYWYLLHKLGRGRLTVEQFEAAQQRGSDRYDAGEGSAATAQVAAPPVTDGKPTGHRCPTCGWPTTNVNEFDGDYNYLGSGWLCGQCGRSDGDFDW